MGADYEVTVTIHSYQNPTGRCDGCRQSVGGVPGCCDEPFIRPLWQDCPITDVTCDTAVDYCIRSLGSTMDSCPEGEIVYAPYAVEESNTYSMSYSHSRTFFGMDNPLIIVGQNRPWTVSSRAMEVPAIAA